MDRGLAAPRLGPRATPQRVAVEPFVVDSFRLRSGNNNRPSISSLRVSQTPWTLMRHCAGMDPR